MVCGIGFTDCIMVLSFNLNAFVVTHHFWGRDEPISSPSKIGCSPARKTAYAKISFKTNTNNVCEYIEVKANYINIFIHQKPKQIHIPMCCFCLLLLLLIAQYVLQAPSHHRSAYTEARSLHAAEVTERKTLCIYIYIHMHIHTWNML